MSRINWKQVIPRAAEIVDEYDTYVTLRQLHYRLVSEPALGYPNTQSAYKRLSELTAEARRERAFPALADLTRSINEHPGWESPKELLLAAASQYRRDRTEGQVLVPILVTEKATLTAQLDAWFSEPLGIPVAPLRGYSSESFDRAIRGSLALEREYRVLYVGDHDPTGEDIERHAREQIGVLVESWQRVALTADQVEEYDLPIAPGKDTDSRARGFTERYGELVQVEVEALAPTDLRDLVQAALDENWDTSAFESVLEQEVEERARLETFAEEWD